jgi:hypothetical protein
MNSHRSLPRVVAGTYLSGRASDARPLAIQGIWRANTSPPDRGLFSRGDWLRLLADVGLEPDAVPFWHSEVEYAMEVFVALRQISP